ncbi:hypothetical protein BCR35DRAFT_310562 [Leucosporidium creatinivorum]|uniref:Succinate dehydrogenase cytochrome b560 subunit n=1 Tax=Leucosporidium creatinivorum TaxID=106004 RepID=A0A1Y2D0K5_9BASI|nr:hypothetical protein BCR35DRAFT_310562 [Leucosporidium creatinivorum]
MLSRQLLSFSGRQLARKDVLGLHTSQLVRTISTKRLSPDQGTGLLDEQRSKRPSSPWHITLQPYAYTMGMSMTTRVSGAAMSVSFYAIFLSHVLGPMFGYTIDSTAMLETFHSLSDALQTAAKVLIAGPLSFHTLNGLRHLAWDRGYFMQLKSSYAAGYAVLASTVASTVALVLW